jgi:hypothetical protein
MAGSGEPGGEGIPCRDADGRLRLFVGPCTSRVFSLRNTIFSRVKYHYGMFLFLSLTELEQSKLRHPPIRRDI